MTTADDPQVRLQDGTSLKLGTIYCIGRNYAEHARELANPVPAEPVVFLKSRAALRPLTDGAVAFPKETFHHEAELVLLIGSTVELGTSGGWQHVRALGLGLDLTRRGVQSTLKSQGLPWTTAKSFAGAALVSDFVDKKRFTDLDRIRFSLQVAQTTRQQGDTGDMLFSVPRLLTYLASLHRLLPGDLVYTGTPPGVGEIGVGDRFTLRFDDLSCTFEGQL